MSNKNPGNSSNEKKKNGNKPETRRSGILRSPKEKGQSSNIEPKKSLKWDEMNVMATLHPADKDYGHMKIEEAPTPYERARPEDGKGVDPEALAASLRAAKNKKLKSENFSSGDDSDEESEERRREKELFAKKRKEHYSEFLEAKKRLGRLPADEESSDDDSEGTNRNKQKNTKYRNESSIPYERARLEDGKGVDPEAIATTPAMTGIQNWRNSNFSSDDEDSEIEPEELRRKKEFHEKKKKERLDAKKRLGRLPTVEESSDDDIASINSNKQNNKQNIAKNKNTTN